jgi:radical SAM protein with 4Fe4S-binding SPASM domain
MSNAEWMQKLKERLVRQRTPVSGTLVLTNRCNLRCVHCYLETPRAAPGSADLRELTTAQVLQVIDQIVAAGCLTLLITGGDPLLRPDFAEIYRYAREQGLVVTVFTNGTLVSDAVVDLFKTWPPRMVEISLYGASAAVHEQVTRVTGSFASCLNRVERLTSNGVRVGLKTVLMTVNQHEMDAMRQLADSLGVRFRVDSAIFPTLESHDPGPLSLRVLPDVAVARELSIPGRLDELVRAASSLPAPPGDRLYICGAGTTSFSIDPYGYVSPCLIATHHRYSLLEQDFATIWGEQLPVIMERTPRADYPCVTCDAAVACSSCPAFNYLENGTEDQESSYVCQTSKLRWQAIQAARSCRASAGESGELAG